MNDTKPPHDTPISFAEINWDEQGQPLSRQFDDVYFSRANGLAETEYVFLQHNRLPERFAQLSAGDKFVIGETGFGSGLNFLAAWRLWQKLAPTKAQLHFVSTERYPLSPPHLRQALSLWPELAEWAEPLLQAYPACLSYGFHRLNFGQVHLTLILGDASDGLAALKATHEPQYAHFANRAVDAWFLDGFAPAKNPEMWQPSLFQTLAQLSHRHTTLATFTAAGLVRRGLSEAGFAVEKVAGFGSKREMAIANGSTLPSPSSKQAAQGLAWAANTNATIRSGPVAVIGAGLAGAHTAQALAEHGIEVVVFDRHKQAAEEASGNPQGVVYAKLSPKPGNQGDFNLQALLYALRHYRPLWQLPELGERCGVLQLAQSSSQAQHQRDIIARLGSQGLVRLITAAEASEFAGVPVGYSGLLFANAGWLRPKILCQTLLDHSRIECHWQQTITALNQEGQDWTLTNQSGQSLGPFRAVVIANANDCGQFKQSAHIATKPVRGQINGLAESKLSAQLKTVICGEGYIAPSFEGQHCVGATFDPNSANTDLLSSDTTKNLEQLNQLLPDLANTWQHDVLNLNALDSIVGRAALRCTTPDYLPIVGPVAIADDMDQRFAPLRLNAKTPLTSSGSYYPGLFVNVGHGSRGLAYTPIAAQLLAAHLLGEPSPLSQTLSQALHPARFIIRDLIRNRR